VVVGLSRLRCLVTTRWPAVITSLWRQPLVNLAPSCVSLQASWLPLEGDELIVVPEAQTLSARQQQQHRWLRAGQRSTQVQACGGRSASLTAYMAPT
jgi:hypothetical protein